jgi:hypothetical protein
MPEFKGPRGEIGIGPSLAYGNAPRGQDAIVYGLDVAYGFADMFWIGGGARSFEPFTSDGRTLLPYAEGGMVLVVFNAGAGYTLDVFPRASRPLSGPHLFFGFVFPVPKTRFYFDPYYRPTFTSEGMLHEVGILAKWTSWAHTW